jgi:hypothetical protein
VIDGRVAETGREGLFGVVMSLFMLVPAAASRAGTNNPPEIRF